MNVKRIKKGTSSFTPAAVASDGTNYYVQGFLKVYRDKGKRVVVVAEKNHDANAPDDAPNRHLSQGREGMVFADGALWACGNSIQVSVDAGETWKTADIEGFDGGYFRAIEVTSDGVYAGGGSLLAYRSNGGDFAIVSNAPPGISAIGGSRQGLLLGDVEGGVWRADAGAFEKTFQIERKDPERAADSDRPVCWCVFETQRGTILIVGSEGVFRSADGGKTFEQTSDEVFSTLQQLPSGEIIAVGMSIASSSDDGLKFEGLLAFENVGYSEKKKSCVHGESVVIASFADGLFMVSPA